MINHPALFWEYNETSNKVDCYLCPQFCHISEGRLGLCKTRLNVGNKLIANNYGKISSIALDPIEKKPLYHYKPKSQILSFGTYGCNMRCSFCQNHVISQNEVETYFLSPEDLLPLLEKDENNIGIAFTYNEPFMWYEYMLDVAKIIKEENKKKDIIVVTNGYINTEPLEAILPYIDAFNIDLKAYNPSTYRSLCGATLEPVLRTIEIAAKKTHVEVTTLMVTGENDSINEIKQIAEFIGKIDRNIPLHLTRYFPNYKMKKEATDVKQILLAKKIAEEYLNYVYVGNAGVDANTYCHKCKQLLIKRNYYQTNCYLLDTKCPKCGEDIPIII